MANRKNSHRRRVRVAVLMVLCGAVFAAFFARLAWMQFVRADYYADKAAEASSASYTVTQHAARGAIVDSAGVVLARDTTVYDVYLRIPAPPGTDLRETVKAIESLTGSKDVETQLAAFFAAASAGELPVMQGVGSDVLTSFYKADLVQSGAVRAAARGVRTWPNGTLLPHALGFTGPITAEQWPTARRRGLAMDAVIGQSGLEAAYDDLLRGQDGRVLVNTCFDGAVRRTVPLREAAPGATLVLTVDSALQKELQNALLSQIEVLRTTKAAGAGRECRAGAAVVVDVQTGGILAAASVPGFDLNRYRSDYAALSADAAAPLLDRVCQGLYAPGSAFKPAVAAAALTAGIDPAATVNCTGRYGFYSGYQPGCLQYGHGGPVDLRTALEYSCNIFFYDVGRRLGVDVFSAMARQLGLATPTGVEITEAQGRLTWSSDENYQAGLTLMAAIGQGNTAVTPLQLAAYAAALANCGQRPRPAFCGPRRERRHRRDRLAVRPDVHHGFGRRGRVRPHPRRHEADGPDDPRPARGPRGLRSQDRQSPAGGHPARRRALCQLGADRLCARGRPANRHGCRAGIRRWRVQRRAHPARCAGCRLWRMIAEHRSTPIGCAWAFCRFSASKCFPYRDFLQKEHVTF